MRTKRQSHQKAPPKASKRKIILAPVDELNRMLIHEIRLTNLNNLLAKFEQEEGSRALLRRFAKHAGVGENLLSQIRNRDRGIGDALARKLEDSLHLGRGWFDAEHANWTAETPEERHYLAQIRAGLRRLAPAEQRKVIRHYLKLVDTLTKLPQKKPAKKTAQT